MSENLGDDEIRVRLYWLPGLIDDVEHVPPKGAVAGAIYRAMRDAYLKEKP